MNKTALIVDDSRVARLTLKKLLINSGFDVIEFGSGEEALSYLKSASTYPDIIFMDVMMVGMDGLTATREIKSSSALCDIPVVMCTGNDSTDDQHQAREAGAMATLTKPPVAAELAAVLDTVQPHIQDNATTIQPEPVTPAVDIAALEANVVAQVESQLQTQMRAYLETLAETECHKQVQAQMAAQMKVVEQHLTTQLKQKVEVMVDEMAKSACQVAAEDVVSPCAFEAVKTVVEEADIPAQINEFLTHAGEEWLTQQEADLGQQLSEQLANAIPPIVKDSLAIELKEQVASELEHRLPAMLQAREAATERLTKETVQTLINQALAEATTETTAEPALEEVQQHIAQLQERMATLRMVTIGLGIVVIGFLIAALLQF